MREYVYYCSLFTYSYILTVSIFDILFSSSPFFQETQVTHIFNRDYVEGSKSYVVNNSSQSEAEHTPTSMTASETSSNKDHRYTQWV